MATVKADHGRLLLDFSWRGQRCREFLGLDDDKAGRAKATQKKKIVEGAIAAGTLDYAAQFPRSKKARTVFAPPPPPAAPEGPPTLGAYAREWLENQTCSNAHKLDRRSLLETHVIKFFGADRPLSAFTIEDVERFINYLTKCPGLVKKGLSGVRINKARALLSALLDRAVKKGWLASNPVTEIKRFRESKADVDPFSFDEEVTLLDKGLKHEPEMQRFYRVAFDTGLRTSEQIGLQWDDLDLKGGVARIRRSVTKADGVHDTKTEGGDRRVDLRRVALAALKQQQASSRLKSAYVFPNRDGGPLDRDNLTNRVWYPALRRAGLRKRKPYQTRHTFASLAIASGEQLTWVAQQLGHANTGMVIRHYLHHVKNTTRQDGSAYDKAAMAAGL